MAGAAQAARARNTTNSEKTSTDNKVFAAQDSQTIHEPPGKDKVLSATVRVPLSYFPLAYKRLHPAAAAPDDATLTALMPV